MITQTDIALAKTRRGMNPIAGGDGAPEVGDEVKALLIMAGLEARWSVSYWKVTVRDASNIVNHVGGGAKRRWQTGVGPEATYEQWLAEINRFWKDAHPGEPLPFPNP